MSAPLAADDLAPDRMDDAWPEPLALVASENTQQYPIDALPDGLREAVAEVVGFVQCPFALAAGSALAALSLSAQALANVRRTERLEGPISLFMLTVADSGERKSSVDGYFLEAVREWERDQLERTKPDVARQTAAIAAWDERRAGVKTRIREASKKGEDCDSFTRELAELEAEAPRPFRLPRLIHTDATPEALAWSLARGWPSGGVMSSEAGIVLGGRAMSRESVMRNLALLNTLWDGVSCRVERRTSENFSLAGARLTMGLAVQSETVRQFFESSEGLSRGMGFMARFLIAFPASTQGTRMFREAGIWRYLPAFSSRLRALLDMPVEFDDVGTLSIPTLPLSADARAVWRRFHDEVERELVPGGEMCEARDVASKAADNVARMAALFHIFINGPVGEIGAKAVTAAGRIVAWHLFQARSFLGDVAAPREVSIAMRLSEWLAGRCARDGVSELSRRVIQNEGPNPVRTRMVLDAALAELVDAGHVRELEEGRRRLVLVNPALIGGRS